MEYRYVLDELKKQKQNWKQSFFLLFWLHIRLYCCSLPDRLHAAFSLVVQFSGICDVFLGLISMRLRLFGGYFEFHCYGATAAQSAQYTLKHKHKEQRDTHFAIFCENTLHQNREFKWMWKSCCVRLTLILNHIIKIFFPYFMVHAILSLYSSSPRYLTSIGGALCTALFASV